MPRSSKHKVGRIFPLFLKDDERARLESDAKGMSLTAYIRWRLFDPDHPPPRTRTKAPVVDHPALAKLLGLLGQSRLSSNINQLARAVNVGALPLAEEVEAELTAAAQDIAEMRRLLVKALGLAEDA